MKVAVTILTNDEESALDPRFGRSAYFLFYDTTTKEKEIIQNPNTSLSGGAGIKTASFIVEKGVEAVITGNVGPNAFRVLQEGNVKVYQTSSKNALQAIKDLENGKLKAVSSSTTQTHSGLR